MEIKLYFLSGETVTVSRKFKKFSIGRLFEIYQDLGLPAGTDFTIVKLDDKKAEILVIESKYLPAQIFFKKIDKNTGREYITVYPQDKYNSAYSLANEKFPNLISEDLFYKSKFSRTGKD